MRKRKRLKTILLLLAAAAVFVLLYLLISRIELLTAEAPEGAETAPTRDSAQEADEHDGTAELVTFDGRDYRLNPNLDVLLILGIDDYGVAESDTQRNTSQSDFIVLALLDRAENTVTLLQLNRDTMANVPVLDDNGDIFLYAYQQLTLAHTYGSGLEDSCENTELAVSMLLHDIPIDNYISVTMDVIPILNDLAGGVTVTIEDDFSGVDDSLVQGSTVTLFGAQAETFVRSRRSMADDPTNIARMRRQRVYMTALAKALKKAAAEDSAFLLEAYGAVSDYLVTDCTVDELYSYAQQMSACTLKEIVTPEGESVAGEITMEFFVDEEALQALILRLFYLPAED